MRMFKEYSQGTFNLQANHTEYMALPPYSDHHSEQMNSDGSH